MSKATARRLLTAVCPEGHTLAEVLATSAGPLLSVRHMTVGVKPRAGREVEVDRAGVPWSVPLSADYSLEASCAICGTDHGLHPHLLRQALSARRRRVVVHPWR